MRKIGLIFLSLILVVVMLGFIGIVSAENCTIPTCNGATNTGELDDNNCPIYACPTPATGGGGGVSRPTQICTDSDGGINYYVKGSAQNSTQVVMDSCVLNNPKQLSETYCENEIAKSKIYDCPNGCSDGACVQETNTTTTPVCQSTKCDDGKVYECKLVNGICSCPTCPSKPAELRCIDSDNGQDYYNRGLTKWSVADGSTNQQEDKCIDNQTLYEGYCDSSEAYLDGKKAFKIQSYTCPNGCKEGACIKGEEVKEQVTCIFQNSDKEQKCYTAYENERAVCSGIGSCVASILGYKGEQITWKSSCGQYQYTIMDGNNEKVGFDCKSGETNIIDIKNKGFTNVYFQCYDGVESKSTDREACKSADYWKKFASNFCAAHCENDPKKCKQKYENQGDIDKCLGKCGINTFSIGNECYLEEITTTPVEECKEDVSCQKSCTCAEGEECKCKEAKCMEGKCVIEETNCVKGTEIVNSMEGRKCCAGLIEVMRSDSTFKCMKEETLFCKDSCPLDGKCYPMGYRKSGNFCSDMGGFTEQLAGDKTCDNNFECSSNVCVSGKCVDAGLLQKILNWFKSLFGGR